MNKGGLRVDIKKTEGLDVFKLKLQGLTRKNVKRGLRVLNLEKSGG